MVAYNFQKQFAKMVETGKKCQTIRAHRKDGRHANKDNKLQLYTGMRTKNCRKLADAICTESCTVFINKNSYRIINEPLSIDITVYCEEHLNHFAKMDGFANFEELTEWFDKAHGLPFEGVLIMWELNSEA